MKEMKESETERPREGKRERGLFQRALIFSPNLIFHHSSALAIVTCDRSAKNPQIQMVNTFGFDNSSFHRLLRHYKVEPIFLRNIII